jgi:hypothetical protein
VIVSERWAILMDESDALSAASLRLMPGLKGCSTEAGYWLTGEGCDEALDCRLKMLAARERYTVDPTNRLIPQGGMVPAGNPPEGPWVSLNEVFEPKAQVACLPGQPQSKVPLRLVRADRVAEPGLLLTTPAAWRDFAVTAPQTRLDRLRFAVCAERHVAVHGRPLPPIPGRRYLEEDGIAVPCGFAVAPPVGPAVLQQLLGVSPGDVGVLDLDGEYQLIPAVGFVVATRSAARLSQRGLERG